MMLPMCLRCGREPESFSAADRGYKSLGADGCVCAIGQPTAFPDPDRFRPGYFVHPTYPADAYTPSVSVATRSPWAISTDPS